MPAHYSNGTGTTTPSLIEYLPNTTSITRLVGLGCDVLKTVIDASMSTSSRHRRKEVA
jgi:hypothetical protein